MCRYLALTTTMVLTGLVCGATSNAQAQSSLVTTTIFSEATGTVEFFPELGILRRAPVGNGIQSFYFRTTAVNRQFRRGFLEFAIPDFDGTLESATLVLTEWRGQGSFPQPPDRHEIGYYEADLVVEAGDYEVPTAPVAEFQTDANLPEVTFTFDVTGLVNAYKARNLGLRIKLAADPQYFGLNGLGTGIQAGSQGSPARIVLVRSGTTEPPTPDADLDGVLDADDNCQLVPNPGQCDSDWDGLGNHCDGDLSNDGSINTEDGVILHNLLGAGTPDSNPNVGDLNCNGYVNAQDMALFRRMLGKAPGPSGKAP